MIAVEYAPSFLRQLEKLTKVLLEEVEEKVELFKDRKNHKVLRVHKLKAELAGRYSFSVNYKYRIVFVWLGENEAGFLSIGDHSIYD